MRYAIADAIYKINSCATESETAYDRIWRGMLVYPPFTSRRSIFLPSPPSHRVPRRRHAMRSTRLVLCLLALSGGAAKKTKTSKPAGAVAQTVATALARGDEHRQKGAYDQAEQAYKAAAKLDPLRSEPHFFLGMNARAEGRTDAAMAHYQEALRITPYLAEAHMNLASLLSQLPGSEEGALEHYAKALELREWPLDLSAQAEYNSGICLYNLRRTGEAQAALERSLAQTPAFAPARELLEQIEQEAAEEADGADSDAPVDGVPSPAPSPPASEGNAPSAVSAASAASAAAASEPPRRTAWRQAGGESTCEGRGGATNLESAMAQLELQAIVSIASIVSIVSIATRAAGHCASYPCYPCYARHAYHAHPALTLLSPCSLQVMRELAQPAAAASAARSAQLAQLMASLGTLLARDLRSV